jgi:hypothetical protein
MSQQLIGSSNRALRVVAKSVYRELKRAGYTRNEMVSFASELLDLVTLELKSDALDLDERGLAGDEPSA